MLWASHLNWDQHRPLDEATHARQPQGPWAQRVAHTEEPPEPTSWGAHSREQDLSGLLEKCSLGPGGRVRRASRGPQNSPGPLTASAECPVPAQAQSISAKILSSLSLGLAPLPPRPQALPGPQWLPGTQDPTSLAPRGLASPHISPGAPEMRKSLLNTTGDCPPRSWGFPSRSFCRNWFISAPVRLLGSLLSLSVCNPLPRSLAQGTLELLPHHLWSRVGPRSR